MTDPTFNDVPQLLNEIANTLARIEHVLTSTNTAQEVGEYLTLSEAAQYTKTAISTFRKLLKDGHVIGFKPAKNWVFKKTDLDDFIKSQFEPFGRETAIVNHRKK